MGEEAPANRDPPRVWQQHRRRVARSRGADDEIVQEDVPGLDSLDPRVARDRSDPEPADGDVLGAVEEQPLDSSAAPADDPQPTSRARRNDERAAIDARKEDDRPTRATERRHRRREL